MKIYKVYAQCVRKAKAIEEITIEEAKDLIGEAVNDMMNDGSLEIEGETDEEVNAEYDNILSRAIEYFEENEYFECGDFEVVKSDEFPTRGNVYGWTRDF